MVICEPITVTRVTQTPVTDRLDEVWVQWCRGVCPRDQRRTEDYPRCIINAITHYLSDDVPLRWLNNDVADVLMLTSDKRGRDAALAVMRQYERDGLLVAEGYVAPAVAS